MKKNCHKIKKSYLSVILLLWAFGILGCQLTNHAATKEHNKEKNTNQTSSLAKTGQNEVRVLDVGQGLSVLIQIDGNNILYDGGGRASSSFLVSRLQKLGIDEIEYLIASHYDEDHIAGLIGVMNTIPIQYILCPDYETDSKIYQSFCKALNDTQAEIIHPIDGDIFKKNNLSIKVISADYKNEEDNNKSIAILLEMAEGSLLISGDCDSSEEEKIIEEYEIEGLEDLDCDIYIAAHHGSRYSSSAYFLQHISPEYVIVSCGEDNSYGHPHIEFLDRVEKCGAQIYRTDMQGEILATFTKSSLVFSTEKTTDDTKTEINQVPILPSQEKSSYILNTKSKKIHLPNCPSVQQMSDINKEYTEKTVEELEALGYQPCKNCM